MDSRTPEKPRYLNDLVSIFTMVVMGGSSGGRIWGRFLAVLTALLLTAFSPVLGFQKKQEFPPDPVRVISEAVILDIVVRDRDGNLMTDLRPDEIEVFDNGKPQEILSLECRSGLSEALVEQAGSEAVPAPQAIGNRTAQEEGTAGSIEDEIHLVSLVFQGLTQQGRNLAHQAALDFLGDGLPPNTYLAVFRMSRTLVPLLNYTNDRTAIERALGIIVGADYDQLPGLTDESPDSIGSSAASEVTPGGGPGGPTGAVSGSAAQADAALASIMEVSSRVRSYHQGQAITDSLMSLILGQRALDGRKTVLFFSEGLFVPKRTADRWEMMMSEANLANVSIYSIDARGVTPSKNLGGVASGLQTATGISAQQRSTAGGSLAFSDMLMFENVEDAIRMDVQQPLRKLADQTGGSFIVSNNPDVEMRRVREDLTSYCKLAYRPRELVYDGSFHKVGVKVSRPGVRVLTRKGYFALPPAGDDPIEAYEVPLLHTLSAGKDGRRFPGGTAVFHYDISEQGIEHVVALRVPLEKLEFRKDKSDQTFLLHFSLMALITDPVGRIVHRLSQDYPLGGSLDQYEAYRRGSVFFSRRVELVPGEYKLSVLLFDQLKNERFTEESMLTVRSEESSVSVSSLVVVDRVEPLSARPEEATNPLRYGRAKIVPNLKTPIHLGDRGQIGFHYVIYPDPSNPEDPILALFILSEGRPIYQGLPLVPARNSHGNIRLVSSLPADLFKAGEYEVWAVVKHGEEYSEEFASFEIVE